MSRPRTGFAPGGACSKRGGTGRATLSLVAKVTGVHEAARVGSMETRIGVAKVPDQRLDALARLHLEEVDDRAALRVAAHLREVQDLVLEIGRAHV